MKIVYVVHMRTTLLYTCTYDGLVRTWERGNIEVGTHGCHLLTWEHLHGNDFMITWEQHTGTWELGDL